jgi:hypothetical protein
MERKRESQQLCGRRKCKNQFAALKAHFSLGRYHPSSSALDALGNPIKTGIFSPLKSDREWRLVAGPPVDMRLATIGAADAVKQANKANRRHWAEAGAAALIQRHHAPDNVVGGYKFPDAPEIEIVPSGNDSTSTPISGPVITNGNTLDIPEFLKRSLPEVQGHRAGENPQPKKPAARTNRSGTAGGRQLELELSFATETNERNNDADDTGDRINRRPPPLGYGQ